MSSEVKLVVMIEVKPGMAEQQIELFQKLRPLVLNESGCLQYELNRVAGSDVKFVLLERWASEQDLAGHEETEHMLQAATLTPAFRAGPAAVIKLADVI